MLKCPVCHTRYIEGQVQYCSTCSWDLTPNLPPLGQLAEGFWQKEWEKVAWAREMWVRLQAQQHQLEREQEKFQSQLQECNQEKFQLQSYVERVAKASIPEEVYQLVKQFNELQSQIHQGREERLELQSKLEQLSQEKTVLQSQQAVILNQLVTLQSQLERLNLSRIKAELLQLKAQFSGLDCEKLKQLSEGIGWGDYDYLKEGDEVWYK
ncbi:MAG TPA: hypothetical protein DDZ80_01055 [Cyanobacteria bacterium UBA8803]|nr:hypothetical protein [Cyanobacteria bacterium UBA9273]HBL57196.1 hypothetical protein [Cyanobacteria bacterium UBA8803]